MNTSDKVRSYVESSIGTELSQEAWDRIVELGKKDSFYGAKLYLTVYLAIALIISVALYFDHILVTILAVILIAGRQHSLYILNHDAAHHGLFKSATANKVVSTLLSNFMMFHHPSAWSYIVWRRVHRFHHTDLFTDRDPNYLTRVNCRDTVKPTSPIKLLFTCLWAGMTSPIRFVLGQQEYVAPHGNDCELNKFNHLRTLLLPFRNDPELEKERLLKLLFFIIAFSTITYFNVWWEFLTYWILPMFLVFPVILAFMDHTEHRWTIQTDNLDINSRSVHLGFIAKIFISFLPRGLHREHHVYQGVIASRLPDLSKILCDNSTISKPISGMLALLSDVAVISKAKI